MKYRVRMDMIFEAETDARVLMASDAALTGQAVCIKAGTT